jgi:hypothetical protein
MTCAEFPLLFEDDRLLVTALASVEVLSVPESGAVPISTGLYLMRW